MKIKSIEKASSSLMCQICAAIHAPTATVQIPSAAPRPRDRRFGSSLRLEARRSLADTYQSSLLGWWSRGHERTVIVVLSHSIAYT